MRPAHVANKTKRSAIIAIHIPIQTHGIYSQGTARPPARELILRSDYRRPKGLLILKFNHCSN